MIELKSPWRCRSCGSELKHPLIDLGHQPDPDQLLSPETPGAAPTARIQLWICGECGLVQLVGARPEGETPAHGHRLALGTAEARDPWIGSLIDEARKGDLLVDLDVDDLASVRQEASLILAGHALSHVEDLDAFMTAVELVLAPQGRLVVEFHHVLGLAKGQFDVLSHAHRSYLSLHVVERLLARHGLVAIAADHVAEYGGTLRVLAERQLAANRGQRLVSSSIERVRAIEDDARLALPEGYASLDRQVTEACSDLREFLEGAILAHRTVAGYGAAARGTALLNIAGVGSSLLPYIADRSPGKQGKQIPGARINVVAPTEIDRQRPDYILIMPWPLAAEITGQLASARTWGARFVVAMPRREILP